MTAIGLASDHAAFPLKQFVKKYLEEKGIEYKDYGTYTEDSCNYATYGHKLAEGIEQNEVERGIAMCGSGEGISMTLNKHQGIRAGLVWRPEIAHLTPVVPASTSSSTPSLPAAVIWIASKPFPCNRFNDLKIREKGL